MKRCKNNKRITYLLLTFILTWTSFCYFYPEKSVNAEEIIDTNDVIEDLSEDILNLEDGYAHKIFDIEYEDKGVLSGNYIRATKYTNDGSDIYRFCVYVETDYDTDADGMDDLVKVFLQVPRLAVERKYQAPVIMDPTPYNAGNLRDVDMKSAKAYGFDANGFELNKLYAKGAKRESKYEPLKTETLASDEWTDAEEGWNYYTLDIDGEDYYQGYLYATDYDYFLERGFAVAMCSGIGTMGSEGYELCGMDLERDAIKCVVEWLAGDENRKAYYDKKADNECVEIEQPFWSNNNIALTGTSYGGTLPFEVAVTGVEGLKTIIPFAGIASWYDYTNSQGVPLNDDASYTDYLSVYNSGGCFDFEKTSNLYDPEKRVYKQGYKDYLGKIHELEEDAKGNYTKIWESMDYTKDVSKINCSALIVHGVNDFNVTTKQADMMQQAFTKAGKEVRLILHQGGHDNLLSYMVSGEYFNQIMNKWLCRYLLNIDNGIENRLPEVLYQDNYDDNWHASDKWRDFNYRSFRYGTRIYDNYVESKDFGKYWDEYYSKHKEEGDINVDEFYAEIPSEYETKYIIPFENEGNKSVTLLGMPKITVDINTEAIERDRLMVTAVLMDVADDESDFAMFKNYGNPRNQVKSREVEGSEFEADGYLYTVKEFIKEDDNANNKHKCVSYGWIDLDNPVSGEDSEVSASYATGAEREKDKYYTYTINMVPTAYTVAPNHHLELLILPWDPLRIFADGSTYNVKTEYNVGDYDDKELDKILNYSFTIDTDKTKIDLPLCDCSKDVEFKKVNYNTLNVATSPIEDWAEQGEKAFSVEIYNEKFDELDKNYSAEIENGRHCEYLIETDNSNIIVESDDYDLQVIDDEIVLILRQSFMNKFDEKTLYNTKLTFTFWDEESYCDGSDTFRIAVPARGLYCDDIPDQIYTGKVIKPEVEVFSDGEPLRLGIDYTLSYGKNNTNVASSDPSKNTNNKAPSVIIKGKGNYSGTITATFSIVPYDISEEIEVDDVTVVKPTKNKTVKATPVVKLGGKKLKLGTDYVVSTTADKSGEVGPLSKIGDYDFYVVGIGSYSGYVPFKFTITDKKLASKVTVKKVPDQEYKGKKIEPAIEVSYKIDGKVANVSDNFTVEYKNNIEIGTATAIITAKPESELFAGSKAITFKIIGKQISKAKLGKGSIPPMAYNGIPYEPELDLCFDSTSLEKNKDYTVSYSKNVNVGTATALVIGKGEYTGTKKFTYKIIKYDVTKAPAGVISVNGGNDITVSYEKGGVAPKPIISMNGIALTEKKDYTIKYANNKSVAAKGTINPKNGKSVAPTMMILFKGNFSGSIPVEFSVVKKDISECKVSVADKVVSTKPNSWKQKVSIIDTNGKKLAAKTDYAQNIKYYSDENCQTEIADGIVIDDAGTTVYVKVIGTNNYAGSEIIGSYRIASKNISSVTARIENQVFTGKEIEPEPKDFAVTDGKGIGAKSLTLGSDYIIESYKNNINKGKASVTIRGINNYCGTKVISFNINDKAFNWWQNILK